MSSQLLERVLFTCPIFLSCNLGSKVKQKTGSLVANLKKLLPNIERQGREGRRLKDAKVNQHQE